MFHEEQSTTAEQRRDTTWATANQARNIQEAAGRARPVGRPGHTHPPARPPSHKKPSPLPPFGVLAGLLLQPGESLLRQNVGLRWKWIIFWSII